jgi:hypothetical protein
MGTRQAQQSLSIVMPGLVPGIHVLELADSKTWMAGASAAMTKDGSSQ